MIPPAPTAPSSPDPQAQSQPPEPPRHLTDPFAPTLAEDGTQVAGKGRILRPLLRKLMGRGAVREGADEATARAAAGAMGTGEQDIVTQARVAPTMTPGPKGPYPGMAEVRTGTTRPLPNVDYYESTEAKQVLTMLERHAQQKVAGPVQTHAQTAKLAAERQTLLNITGKPAALSWSPEELLTLRNSLEAQAKELDDMTTSLLALKQTEGRDPYPAELAQFELASRRLVATNNAVAGLSSEAGRLLNSLRIPATDTGMQIRAMAGTVQEGGGAEAILERMGAVRKAGGDPRKINKAINDSWREKAWSAILQVRYNMMLSSVRTHAANVAGSTMTGTWEFGVINPLAYMANLSERGVRKLAGGPGTLPGDIVAPPYVGELRGLLRGTRSGIKLAWDIARGAEVPAESMAGKFINESGMRYRPQDQPTSLVGKTVTLPTRMLEAEDAFFRSTYYNARLDGLAQSMAAAAHPGDAKAAAAAYQALIEAPPEGLHQAAKEYSQKLTFTNDLNIYGNMLGTLAGSVAKLQNSGPLHLIVPFVRTPANLLGYSLEAAGMGPVIKPLRTWQSIVGDDPRDRAEAIARVTAGAGLMMLLQDMAEKGDITGIGSANYQGVRLLESAGWRQNSLRVGDTYYELNRLDPLGLTMALAASYHELYNERNLSVTDKTAAAGAMLLQLGDLMLDRSYMSSLGQLVDAVQSGEAGVKQLQALTASTLGTSMITPNVMRDFREATDEFRREQAFDPKQGVGILDRFTKNMRNALPGYSKQLPVALDWRGKPITNDGHYVLRGTMPVRMSEIEAVPATTRALLENEVLPRKPRTMMTIPGAQGAFQYGLLAADDGEGHVYSYYQQLVGEAREAVVTKVIESSQYEKAVEQGHTGSPDSPAGRALRLALGKAEDLAKLRFMDELEEGASVTLYPGTGAELEVVLPQVDTREWKYALREYMRATPEERDVVEVPSELIPAKRSERGLASKLSF